ncbi:MAG: hypothetical protein QOJ72_1833 [Nocardioidaceae bacterium]|nr:hypothetical protein [Nocardioidaceae bacterium]
MWRAARRVGITGGALLATALAGCGSGPAQHTGAPPTSRAATISSDGTFKVGVKVPAGVYVTKSATCLAYTARTATFTVESDDADNDSFIAAPSPSGSGQRITLKAGQYFTTQNCAPWTKMKAARAALDDPATRSGACHILVGPNGAVAQALALVKPGKATAAEKRKRSEVQDRLFAIVAARTAKLQNPAGELVDVLDAPSYFVKDGRPVADVMRTVARIKQVCHSS